MRNKSTTLAIIGLALMIVVGCGSSPDDASAGDITQVHVGMTEQEVIDVLGEPDGTGKNDITGENALIFKNKQKPDERNAIWQIWFLDGKVTDVMD